MSTVEFGLFDHVDRGEAPIGDLYASRLALIEAADRAGFRTYHVAEHHATRLGMAPSPSVFLAAVAQRTRRIRLGPLVYILPLYAPLRLIEEICMLDQLSGGRFELGVGRGISPYELAYCGLNFHEAVEMYAEALEVILAGLQTRRLTHHGRYYRYLGVPIELEPVQKPYPPLWQGIVSVESARDAARRGVSVVGNAPNATMKSVADAYHEARQAAGRGVGGAAGGAGLVGMQRHVYVGESDAEALEIAKPAYRVWYESLTSLWRAFGSVPYRFSDTLERALANDAAIVGSPATVRGEIERHIAETGCNYLVTRFAFGTLTHAQAARSLDLFASEVLPRFGRR